MCIDAPESTTNSRSSGFRVDAGKHLLSEGEKNAALISSFNYDTLLANSHTDSRALRSCHSVSSRDQSSNFWNIGVTLMKFTWSNSFGTKDFGLECQHDAPRLYELNTSEWSAESMKTSAAPFDVIRRPLVVHSSI